MTFPNWSPACHRVLVVRQGRDHPTPSESDDVNVDLILERMAA